MCRHKKWMISSLSNEKWACERVRHLSRLQDVLSGRVEEDSLEAFHSVSLTTKWQDKKNDPWSGWRGDVCSRGNTQSAVSITEGTENLLHRVNLCPSIYQHVFIQNKYTKNGKRSTIYHIHNRLLFCWKCVPKPKGSNRKGKSCPGRKIAELRNNNLFIVLVCKRQQSPSRAVRRLTSQSAAAHYFSITELQQQSSHATFIMKSNSVSLFKICLHLPKN